MTPALRAFARRAVSDAATVEDLVQETLLAAITGLGAFAGRAGLRTWVMGILSRKCIDHYRRAKRWEPRDVDAEPEDLLAVPASAERALADRQMLGILDAAMRRLPEQERMAVM